MAFEQDSEPDCTSWFVLTVTSGFERKACIWLRRRQYKPYWARFIGFVKLNRHRRAQRWCSVLPGYLFLPAEGEINWRLIFSECPGVSNALRNGFGDYVSIPDIGPQGMEKIREIEAALNQSAVAARDGIPFKRGQTVKIIKLGVNGEVVRIDSRRQIHLLAPLFGSAIRIVAPCDELEAV